MAGELGPVHGELHASVRFIGAFEEREPKALLHLANRVRKRGLRDAEFLCRFAEMTRFCELLEIAQMVDVHYLLPLPQTK